MCRLSLCINNVFILFFLVIIVSINSTINAQANDSQAYWQNTTFGQSQTQSRTLPMPTNYQALQINVGRLKTILANAPLEQLGLARSLNRGLQIEIPLPDGTAGKFEVWESPIMEPALAQQFPDIKTYIATQVDKPGVNVRFDCTPLGFHCMIMDPAGWSFIEPVTISQTTADYISYYKKDSRSRQDFHCGVEGSTVNDLDIAPLNNNNFNLAKINGTQLRTYRLAVAATAEYTAVFGGTVPLGQAAIVTSINRVNGVYENEVSVRMILVANNSSIVYTNATTDPYTNGDGVAMLSQNQTTCDGLILTANYDFGHVFSTGGGGVASLGVPCVAGSKARGVTGSGAPFGDAYDIDYVAHEMGHQFGGNHTFNSVTGSCSGGNRSAANAYEPGSGITIMAYAGICSTDDLAPNSIAYFHARSFEEIATYTNTGSGNTCPVTTATGNQVPVGNAGADYTIPKSTPFTLTGSATDGNGDALLYSWDEMDKTATGGSVTQTQVANLDFPLFRPFKPTSSPARTFPKIADIVNNTTTIGERLPTVSRILDFRFMVRDNRVGGGGTSYNDVTQKVTIDTLTGPFIVTAPNTAVSWSSGTIQTVNWNVANTTGSLVNCANVKISLSSDGGFTYPTVILANTPNDGSEAITVPGIITNQARIKVEAVGNIFFDISNVNFTIVTGSSVLTTITTSALAVSNICVGSTFNVAFTTDGPANAGNIFTAQLSNPSGSFSSGVQTLGTLSSTNAGTITATIPAGTTNGSLYRVRVISSNPSITGTDVGSLSILSIPAAAGTISGPISVCQGQANVVYSVATIANATSYNWTVPSGITITSGVGTSSITVNISASAATPLVITVAGANAGCNGSVSPNKSIAVNALPAAAGAISGTATVCQNQTGVTYSIAPISGATGYNWTLPSGASITAGVNTNSITVSFNNSSISGNVSVSGTNTCGYGTPSVSFAVNVNTAPASPVVTAAGPISVCTPSSVSLGYAPVGGVSYQWRKDGVNIVGANSTPYAANLTGNYDVVASQTSVTAQTFTNSTVYQIPENSCVGANSTIAVSGYSNNIPTSKIYIKIDITHTWDADLVIFLEAPSGAILGLANLVGSNGDNFTNTVFADSGLAQLPATGAPYTGLYKPWATTFTSCITSTITTFGAIGGGALNPNGNWVLRAYDRAAQDVGTINNWSITLPGVAASCTSTSNVIGVTIKSPPAISNFNSVTDTIGGVVTVNGSGFTGATAVSFNGVNAAFTLINDNQLTATVPAGASNGLITITTACGTANTATSFTVINYAILNFKVYIQGLYSSGMLSPALFNQGVSANNTVADSIQIILRQAASPYLIDTIIKTLLPRTGMLTIILPANKINSSFYIVVKHRNSMETWSKQPVTIGSNTSFDFTQ